MSRKELRRVYELIRLMFYALAHRPDEFGLAPDAQGFVSTKELLQAFHEEPEWKFVRESHLTEALIHDHKGLFQREDNRIRATEIHWEHDLARSTAPASKILFSPIRRRAHQHVFEKGLRAPEGRWIILCIDRQMATRIGKRRDPSPVILEIRALDAHRDGVALFRLGSLFLAKEISPKYIGGPLPPKEEPKRISQSPGERTKALVDLAPGTFVLDITRDPDPQRRVKGRKPKGWKEQARKIRKRKR